MLPLKVFNALPSNIRLQISRIVFGHMSSDFIHQMATPFHHNFYYGDGHWYKLMLDHCTYSKGKKQIKVTITIPI